MTPPLKISALSLHDALPIYEIGGTPLRVLIGDIHPDPRRGQTVGRDALDRQIPAAEAGGLDRGVDRVQRRAGVDERREQHVAGHAGEGVDPAAHRRSPPTRGSRWAAIAAPNPESMLTTVTPAAQDACMARSAVTPSSEAPYPVEVGTAITGQRTRPPTTLANAPSMPATTTTAS